MKNASSVAGQTQATAVCAAKPSGYRMVSQAVTNPAGSQTGLTVACPTGTVVLSGGAQTTADSPGSWLTSEGPTSSTKSHVVNWNGTASSQNLAATVICAKKPPSYQIVTGSATVTTPSVAIGGARCPAGTVAISGGVLIGTPDPRVSLDGVGSFGTDTQWAAEVLDTVTGSVTIHQKAICAA